MKSSAKKIELASVDDLFSTEEGRQDAKLEKIQEIPLVHNIWKPSGCRITQWGQLGEILGGVRFPWAGSLPVTDDFPICAGCQGQMAHNKKTNRILYFAGNGAGLMACPVFRLT